MAIARGCSICASDDKQVICANRVYGDADNAATDDVDGDGDDTANGDDSENDQHIL